MNANQKFENGMSIVQLEERFEMLAAEGDRKVVITTEVNL
jgi:hypothetical protein